MARTPCCSRLGLNRGAWTVMEDQILKAYIKAHGEGKWRTLPKRAGLKRCGKSCRLRWLNYLKPGIKRGNICPDEDELIIKLHNLLGNRWSLIAGRLPGRTDNEIKNYWNTTLSKKIGGAGPVAEKSSPRKSKAREPVSAEGKVSKTLISAVPAAIRTKARRLTKGLLPNVTTKNGDSILNSATQTAVEQLMEQLNQENASQVENLQIAHYNDLDLVKFNSSGCFDVCDNHVENEMYVNTDDLSLMSSKYQLPVDDHTTSAWTPSDFLADMNCTTVWTPSGFFADMNSTIDLGAWTCFLDDKEELPSEENN